MPEQRQQVPLNLVGGNKYGRYPKISIEQTVNMIVSDNALVDYAGYQNEITLLSDGSIGRALYSSLKIDIMIAVVGTHVYAIRTNLDVIPIGTLSTVNEEVYISENNNAQIVITDTQYVYIYNMLTPFVPILRLDLTSATYANPVFPDTFRPGFVAFQNQRMLIAWVGTSQWVLTVPGQDLSTSAGWAYQSSNIGLLQTKPDTVQAAIPFPGRGNMLFLMGQSCTEQWTDQGLALFPYQRSSSFNVDYGCINPACIAYQDSYIVWLAQNEEAGIVLMYSTGGETKAISTDGIDYRFSTLTKPEDVFGFLVKIDGHLIYQFTFVTDNLTFLYDFNTGLFFSATDEDSNYHIAHKVVFFNNKYYFVSSKDGNLYQLSTSFTNYNYGLPNATPDIEEIPRSRVCGPIRLPSEDWFILNQVRFTIENGRQNFNTTNGPNMVIDLSISRDGGETFGNRVRYDMNATGQRKSRLVFWRLGQANDATVQIEFWGNERFIAFDGYAETYL